MNSCKIYLILLLSLCSCAEKAIEVDLLIINGTVYDGRTAMPEGTSVAIKKDKIVYIGQKSPAQFKALKTIDALGLIVAPGFIDPHTHSDRELVEPGQAHNQPFLFQGITTVVVGNDGSSFFPASKFVAQYESQGIGTNVALLAGHGTIRQQVMGKSDRKATPTEIVEMQKLVQEEMDAGAIGISTGLFYAPGSYASTQEVIELAKTASKNNGIYDTHLRDESSYTVGLIPAIEEVIEIGKQAELPVHISHIKCLGVDVWHQSDTIVSLIEKARKSGIQLTANQYPYDASATGLKAAVVPRWAESGGKDSLFIRYNDQQQKAAILEETKQNIVRRGGPDKLLIVKADDSLIVGKTLLEVSALYKLTPQESVYKILESGYVRIASFNMNKKDIHNFMQQSWVVTGSDGNTGHPRKYGSFPRKYYKYVQQDSIIDILFFINNSTSRTAEIFKIRNRGRLVEGYYADVIVFDPKIFRDKADYTDAFQYSEGLKYSIINGYVSIDKGVYNNKLNGTVLVRKKM